MWTDPFREPSKIEGLFAPLIAVSSRGTEVVVWLSTSKGTKEVVMTIMVTLTATTVLLSSLLLLRRIW
jgi:hypothetical protein